MENKLIGKTITKIMIAEDKEALLFLTPEEELVVRIDADCCSNSWIENIEIPAMGFPCKILEIEELYLGSEDSEEYDYLQKYGVKITTDKGLIEIDYRNSSNGYYGGSISWPEEYHYGGVYGQNKSNEKWREI